MSGGLWKDAAMRLYDTATNFEGAVAAYMKVPDAPHENHVSATWRKLAEAKKRAYDMAKEDEKRTECAQPGITPQKRESVTARSPLECPRCGATTMHVWVGDDTGTWYHVACPECGLSSAKCRSERLANESWKDVLAQMAQAKPAGEGSKDVQ